MKEKLENLKKKIFNQDSSVNGGKRVMNLNRLLSEKTFLIVSCVAQDLLILLGAQYIFNLLFNIPDWLNNLDHPWNYIGLRNLFPRIHNLIKIPGLTIAFYIFLFIAMAVLDAIYVYRTKISFGESTLNIDQRGEARWTTNEEIKAQYKCIPDCETPTKKNEFNGPGGTIVSRIGRNLYIDPSPTNNLIIGITRSGKGEMFVFPSIDVYSRAKEKTSLVITDPKLELFKSSKETLIKRGYDVYLLNLDDPLHSMGFNPLEKIKEAYLRKDYSDAELLAQSFSFSVFNDPTNTDTFWQDSAASLLTAMILAHVQDCIEMDEKINNIRLFDYNQKRNRFDNLSDERKEEVRANFAAYMEKHPDTDPIMDHGLECMSLPEDVEFIYTRENEQKINMYSIINTFTELSRQKLEGSQDLTKLDAYFANRPELDRAKLKYAAIEIAGDRTKGSIFSTMLVKLTVFTFENVAKMTAESTLQLENIGFGDKPVAVFLGIPDYDKSMHFLATVFIRQVTFVLEKKATRTKAGKCDRKVKFICDEFGNIPAIEAMDSIITVCLSRNISFDLYIQANSQLRKLYGDDAETIMGNCGNQIFILTNDDETSETFSKNLGNRTIIDVNRSGSKLSRDKNYTESVIEKPLLNMNQLEELREGECVVKRVMLRKDLERNRIRPTPIFNSEESGKRFLYRYEYLSYTFPDPDSKDLALVNKEDRSHIDHRKRVWNYQQSFDLIEERKATVDQEQPLKRVKNLKDLDEVRAKLRSMLSAEEMQMVTDDLSQAKLMEIIQKSIMKETEKKQLLSFIQGKC